MRRQATQLTQPSSDLIDDTFDRYITWREKREAVRGAYAAWRDAAGRDRDRAYHAYTAALDREELAAAEYQRLIELASRAGLRPKVSYERRSTT